MAAQTIPVDSLKLELERDPDRSLRIDRHRCRFCGCTEDRPCQIPIRRERDGTYLLAFDETQTRIFHLLQPCTWYIPGVCSNPACVQLLIQESHEAARTVRMRRNG